MNFVQNLEECLRDLAAASRQRHPGVKEASERAVMKLRSLQSGYVSAVRKASTATSAANHPTTSLFQSSDLLHPFLLAANYPNADYKLLEISFRAMRLLMEADALVPSDGIHMVRVYQIQAQVVTAYYQKQYAKEIQKSAAAAVAESAASTATEASSSDASTTTAAAHAESASASGGGWFGWGSSSNSGSNSNTNLSTASQHGGGGGTTSSSSKVMMKNAVSSSTGKTGQAALSGPLLEKLALEILSSLLQLLQLLRNYPDNLTMELWTNSVALACLWFYLPPRHTVQQAAHSTVSQIISLLYQTEDSKKSLIQPTWDDLLALTGNEQKRTLNGAFKLCKRNKSDAGTAAVPPSPEFALELMTQVWKEMTAKRNRFVPSDSLLVKSMGVTITLLEQMPKQSVEKSLRVVQWTLALFQSHAKDYSVECRELLLQLIKQIPTATDACRKHHDFEDGYVFNADDGDAVLAPVGEDSMAQKDKRRSPELLQTVFPSTSLWKAGLVLEATYHILDKNSSELSVLFEDGTMIQSLAEALSDFATIGTCSRDHILQVVGFCQLQNPSNVKPTVFRKAEQTIASGASFSDGTASKGSDKVKPPIPILGEAIWLSLQGVLQLGDCLKATDTAIKRTRLLDEIFSPSLSILQHVLKRFSGCEELVLLALKGYSTLADTCLPIEACSVESKVLLTSLSKLSLPTWGKHDSSSLLRDQHVRSLLCLLRILHRYPECLSSEWEILLWTFEELSVLDIASPLLTDAAYHASLAVSAAYSRFASFSTCFSDESLILMTEALTEICEATMAKRDVVGESETVLPDLRTNSGDAAEKNASDDRETISGKIMSIGVRAIYGSGGSETEKSGEAPRLERTKKAYYQDYRSDFVSRISSANSTVRLNAIGRIPFALVLLSDVAMTNTFRSKECGAKISSQFSRLAAASPVIRPLVMDITTMLMMSQLSSEPDLPMMFKGRGRIVFEDPMHSQLLAVEPAEIADRDGPLSFSQAEVLAPLCESIQSTLKADVARASLEVLNTILEGTGQNLSGEVWSLMIDSIASLSGDSSYKLDRASPEWSACCLMAFRSLKLIVDDFLEQLPCAAESGVTAHISLLECCSSFVGSRHDINTSLTAIGLLWTIADQDSDSAAIDRALSKLVLLSSDDRPEVRNAAVNTLFSCIAGRGGSFSSSYWESCITSTVFGVYDIVTAKAGAGAVVDDGGTSEEKSSRYNVRLHHSRDSAGKMWFATQVLVLRGLSRVLRIFFPNLLDTVDGTGKNDRDAGGAWFEEAWTRILDFALEAASQGSGRDNLEIRSVGVELLVVCCQLASKAGIQAAVGPAKVSTNMEVVNGALRSVRESASKATIQRSHTKITELARHKLFLEAFESLEAFEEEVLRKRHAEDDTDQQILSKFCSNLGQLYACGLGHEFKVDDASRSIRSLQHFGGSEPNGAVEDQALESRFVRIVMSALSASGGDPKSRFLNQGQRGSLDLLRSMASNGSSASFERLVVVAGPSFFVRKESDGDESDHGDEETKHSATLLMFEAASAVSHEISNDNVSDECRMFILFMVLTDFLADNEDGSSVRTGPKQRRYYKRFVPIMKCGIESSSRLSCKEDDASSEAVERLWVQILQCLAVMQTPVPLGKDMIKIPRVSEILSMVSCAGAHVPRTYAKDLCTILSEGASKAFDAAKQHAENAAANPESDFGRKSKRHRDDLLKLFYACFSGSCLLGPAESNLCSIARSILTGALSKTHDSMHGLCIEASMLLCHAMEGKKEVEALVISVFPVLCQLVISEESKLKAAAGRVLIAANIAETLQLAQGRYKDAEQRAICAEQRVAELEAEVERLQTEKTTLQASESRRGLWNFD